MGRYELSCGKLKPAGGQRIHACVHPPFSETDEVQHYFNNTVAVLYTQVVS